jgi:hypothetical protein
MRPAKRPESRLTLPPSSAATRELLLGTVVLAELHLFYTLHTARQLRSHANMHALRSKLAYRTFSTIAAMSGVSALPLDANESALTLLSVCVDTTANRRSACTRQSADLS